MPRLSTAVAVTATAVLLWASAVSAARPEAPAAGAARPVVLLHGLLADSEAMSHAQAWIAADYPDVYVHNAEIGNGKDDSLLMDINEQCANLCNTLKADAKLASGFDLIGHSQGGLLTRCYIERCNDPPVHNYVSWAGPHGGQYGVPDFNIPYLDQLFDKIMEDGLGTSLQHFISFAAYWKDPLNYTAYLEQNEFLADLNNEGPTKNATYKAHFSSLNHAELVYSTTDTIVIPNTSPTFAFFTIGQATTVTPMNQTDQYKEDWLGLQTLDKAGKLHVSSVDCTHQNIPRDVCKTEVWDGITKALVGGTL